MSSGASGRRSLRNRSAGRVMQALADRGYVVRRHPAVRRQSLLESHDVGVVFDVGAAVGSYGQELRRFGYRGTIVSFEPMGAPFAQLSAAAAGDRDWTVVHAALGERSGSARINVAANSDSSSLLPMASAHLEAAPHVTYDGTEEIELKRLDEVAEPHLVGGRPAFLKLDTQGYDHQVLAGAAQTLDRCVGLQIELSLVTLYEGGRLVDESMSWAYDHGYVLTGIEPGFAAPDGRLLQADGIFFRTEALPDRPVDA